MSTPTIQPLAPVPLKDLYALEINSLGKFLNPQSLNMSIILRMCIDPENFTVDNIELLDVRNEITTNVHPSDMIQWIKTGKLLRLEKGIFQLNLPRPL